MLDALWNNSNFLLECYCNAEAVGMGGNGAKCICSDAERSERDQR